MARRPAEKKFVALLGLKEGAVLSIDGKPLMLKTNDFVGFELPLSSSRQFHLITAKPSDQAAVTIGFLVESGETQTTPLIRQYDAQTEEISSQPVDSQTARNLQEQVSQGSIDSHRMIPYQQMFSEEEAKQWNEKIKFVSGWLIEKRKISGAKIVPGSYQQDDNNLNLQLQQQQQQTTTNNPIIDGVPISYPSIPIIVSENGVSKSRSHQGTKSYLETLTPSDRTSLFIDPDPEHRLLGDILRRHYENDWRHILGDIQLSFVMFLHLKCLHSLEHW
jgi:hypothetical protein